MAPNLTCTVLLLIALGFVEYAFFGTSVFIVGVDGAPIISQDGFGFSMQRRRRMSTPEVTMKGYNTWLSSGTMPIGMFGGVFDGRWIWLTPCNGDRVVRLDPVNGTMVGDFTWPNDFTKAPQAFESSVFDGVFVWLIPYSADRIFRLNPLTGNMTGFGLGPSSSLPGFVKGPKAFQGATFDGSSIWLIPCDADRIIRFNVSDGSMTGYATWPVGFSGLVAGAYSGGVYDGHSQVWLVPHNADSLISISGKTGNISGPFSWPSTFSKVPRAFVGGVSDGSFIWLVPHDADQVIRIRTSDGNTSVAGKWPSTFTKGPAAFAGGLFDGTSIWLVPHASRCLVRINVSSEEMLPSCTWAIPGFVPGTYSFVGGVFDGQSLWLVPFDANMVVGLHFDPSGNTSTHTSTPTLTEATASFTLSQLSPSATNSEPSSSASWSSSRSLRRTRTFGHGNPKQGFGTDSPSSSPTLSSAVAKNESTTSTVTRIRLPTPAPRPRVNALARVLPSETVAKVVAVGSVAIALAVSAFTPTMSVQAGRPFALLRMVDCKLASVLDLQGDDPDYLEFPIQTHLGTGAFPNYVGSMALSVGLLVGIPTVALASLYLILRRSCPSSKPLHLLQRKLLSSAFFTSVGYFLPSVWKVLVLITEAATSSAASIVLVAAYAFVDAVIFCVLLYTAVREVPRIARPRASAPDGNGSSPNQSPSGAEQRVVLNRVDFYVDDPAGAHSATTVAPLEPQQQPASHHLLSEQRVFEETFGPLYSGVRNFSFPVRIYFLEDLLVSIVMQVLDGVRPTEPTTCRSVAISITFVVFLHLIFLVLARPYAEKVELALTLVGSFILLSMGIFACIVVFTENQALSDLSLSALGYLALAESVYFFAQLVLVGIIEFGRMHRRRVKSQWSIITSYDEEGKSKNEDASAELLKNEGRMQSADVHHVGLLASVPSPVARKDDTRRANPLLS